MKDPKEMTNQELREEFERWYGEIGKDSKAIEPIVNAQRLFEEAKDRINALVDEFGFIILNGVTLKRSFYAATKVRKRR